MLILIKLVSNLVPVGLGAFAIFRLRASSLGRSDKLARIGLAPFRFRELAIGLAIGCSVFIALFWLALGVGWIGVVETGWPARTAFATILMFLAFAIGEEFVFRALCFAGLRELGWGPAAILLVSSLFFSLGHIMNEGASVISSISAIVGGMMYGIAYLRTGRLWLPIGLHFAWNFAQGFVFGFPVSGENVDSVVTIAVVGPELWIGGAYGPEGSLAGIAARVAVIVALTIVIAAPSASLPLDRARRL